MKGKLRYYGVLAALLVILGAGTKANAQATDAHVKAAMRLIDLGNARQAVSDLTQLVANEPKNAEAHAGLAIADLEMNNVAQAAQEAQAGFDIDRKNVLVRLARGMVYGRQGRKDDALNEFNTALKQNDKEVGSYLALSRYYLSIDSLNAAEVTLYRAQKINDKDVRSYIGLAELYERQHIPALAISQYNQAQTIDPSDVTVMARLASMYYRQQQYNNSVNEWLKILRTDSTYADAYYQVGNLYYLAGQYQNAAAYANRYVAMKPNDVYGQWLLAKALTEIGQYQQAMPALEAVASNDSLKALSQVLLARSYFYSKDYPKSISIFKNATNLGPLDYSYYGLALIVSGDTTGGIEQLQRSLVNDTVRSAEKKLETQTLIGRLLYAQKRMPESAKVFGAIADANPTIDWDLTAGQIYTAAKDPAMAEQYYNKALAIDSTSMKAWMQLAMAKTGDMASEPALSTFEHLAAAARAHNNTDTLGVAEGYIGYHYAALKQWAKAADHLEVAVKNLDGRSPYLASFESLLGNCYLQTKEFEKAGDAFQRALKLNPSDESAKKGIEYLEQVKAAGGSGKGAKGSGKSK